MRSSVDLPQPEGPTITMNSPSADLESTPWMTSKPPVALADVAKRDVGHSSISPSPPGPTNHLCMSMTTSAGGSMASMAVAITSFHSVERVAA